MTQINILIGTIIASFQAGAVSYLYYADRIYQINLAIAGIAIGVVILPQLSKLIEKNNSYEISNIQNKALELSFFLSLPAAAALLIAPEPIVSSLFGYGKFSGESVENTSKALFYFALGLPAFALIKVFSTFFFARHNTKIPFYISLISVFINIVISISLFKHIGFLIIPIATTISSWINTIFLYTYLIKSNFFEFNNLFKFRFPRIIFSSIIMGIVLYLLINQFEKYLNYYNNYKLLYLLIIILFALISYFLISFITKAFKLSDIKLKY